MKSEAWNHAKAIARLYKNGLRTQQLGRLFGCDRSTITQILMDQGIKPYHKKPKPYTKAQEQQVIALYKTNLTQQQIADKTGVIAPYVRKILKDKEMLRHNARMLYPYREAVIRLYKEGATIRAIAAKYGVSGGTVSKFLDYCDVPKRNRGRKKRWKPLGVR